MRFRFASLALSTVLVAGLFFVSTAAAQVVVVEEQHVPESQVVERGTVRADGRGIQYGAHFISPVYVTRVGATGTSPRPTPLTVDGGLGLQARVGWEFPSGFTLELQGGFAVNALPEADLEMSNVFTRVDVGAAARYMFFNDTAFVPFVELGAGLRWHFFDWRDASGQLRTAGEQENMTLALKGAVGAQIELTPYFGIEVGCAVDYGFAGPLFAEGLVSIVPFAGVTLYTYDESGH